MKAFVFALATALIWGIAPILEKVGLAKVEPTTGVILRGFGVAAAVFVIMLIQWNHVNFAQLDKKSVLFILAGGILATAFGQLFFYRALKLGDASTVVPLAASYPLVTFIAAMIFLGESVTATKIFGLGLVLTGVYFLR
jgi:transporter family protein